MFSDVGLVLVYKSNNEQRKLYKEEAKDPNDQEKEQLDTYDLFRLNLILKPDGSMEQKHDE